MGPVSFGRLVGAFGSAAAVLAAARRSPRRGRSSSRRSRTPTAARRSSPATARAIVQAANEPEAILGPGPPRRRRGPHPGRCRRTRPGSDGSSCRRRSCSCAARRRRSTGRGPSRSSGRGARRRPAARRRRGSRTRSPASARRSCPGLALGIDGAAHVAAVDAGTPTVAVIGGGHERLYPAAHRGLVRADRGRRRAVISEFAPDTIPSRGTFPRRNRIISGLADATVVVEAGARSGALTTAAWALEQGRGLFLVPGRLDDPTVAGCLAFLREAGPEARVVAGHPGAARGPRARRRRRATTPSGAGRDAWRSAGTVLAALPPVERAIAGAVVAGTVERRRARRSRPARPGHGPRRAHGARDPRPRDRGVRPVPRGRAARRRRHDGHACVATTPRAA